MTSVLAFISNRGQLTNLLINQLNGRDKRVCVCPVLRCNDFVGKRDNVIVGTLSHTAKQHRVKVPRSNFKHSLSVRGERSNGHVPEWGGGDERKRKTQNAKRSRPCRQLNHIHQP